MFILLLFIGKGLFAQTEEHEDQDHGHEHHKHEIGIANSPVYYIKEKELNYGLHVHYV